LSGGLVETGGDPLLSFPGASLPDQPLQIPAPFNDLPTAREDLDEAERVDLFKRQTLQFGIGDLR
jgi:hypothetical protein